MQRSNTFFWLIIIITAIVATGCTKDPALSGILSSQITISTQPASSVGQTSAFTTVQISGGFSDEVIDKGICWSTIANPTISQNKSSGGPGSGAVNLNLTGLTPGTTYYVRGYFSTSFETVYSEQKQFTTVGYQLATLTTSGVSSITLTSAVSGGNVTALGGGVVTSKGVCWNTSGSPSVSNSRTSDGSGLGAFTSNLTGLLPGTTFYVRAYATNQAGTVYGPQVSFTTVSISLAAVGSPSISAIGLTSASAFSNVTADGGGTITAKGVCWNTSGSPTITGSRTLDGTGLGSFGSTLTGLNPGATYYIRAYATNQAGTSYGTQSSFTTLAVQLPTVGSITVSQITRSTASILGSVTADGGGTVTSRGICWSSNTTTPTITSSSFVSNGSGTGSVSASLSGLLTVTTYYVRAYATNAAGTSYGPVTSFRTL